MLRPLFRLAPSRALLVGCLLFAVEFPAFAQDTYSMAGTVVDEEGEPLTGATVAVPSLDRGTTTDARGQFRLDALDAGTYVLEVRFLGFQPERVEIAVPGDAAVRIRLVPDAFRIADVIVTASPLGETAYQAVQALSPQDLQERAGSSFGELLDGEPGVAMRSFGPAPARPVIRGFDGDRVLILENGERMGDISNTAADHNITLDPLAAERIEIVRGPASLLYGSSALGGVVNILTRDIPRDWSPGTTGTLALEGASVNRSVSGLGRYQWGSAAWAGTARLSYRGAGDVRTPAGSLPGTAIDNFEAGIGVGHQRDAFDGGLAFSGIDHTFGLPDDIDDTGVEAEIQMNKQTLQGRAEWSFDRLFESAELRLHGARLSQEEVETTLAPDGSVDQNEVELRFLQWAGSATVTLQHRPVGSLGEGVLGANVQARRLTVGGSAAFTPGVEGVSAALFTFQEVPLHATTRLQFGLRGEVQTQQARPNDGFPAADAQRTAQALSGSIGLNVQPRPELEMGIQVARAHRFPILQERFADGVHFGAGVYERGAPSLGTEVGLGADVFARWKTERLYAEVAGFYNRVADFVAFTPTGEVFEDSRSRTWDIFTYRAGDAVLSGGEAQMTLAVTEAWQFGSTVDYVRGTRADSDEPLPTIPPLRGRFTARYDVDRWWIEGQTRLVSTQNRTAAEERPTDGYALYSLMVGVQLGQDHLHRITFQVENLTNTLYRDHLSRIDRSEFGFPMPGRNARLSYRYLF